MRRFIQKTFLIYVFLGEYIVKSGTLEFDTDQPVTNLKTTDDIPNQITPRQRKPQRNLEKVDQILENVNTPQYSDEKKNILKLRNTKTENAEVQNVNEKEKLQITPRQRKSQRTLTKLDQILDNVNTLQYSNEKKNILKFRTRKK